jgi:hypothetical protein
LVEPRAVFEWVTERILEAYYKRRPGDAAKWATDLIYYASLEGLVGEYVRLMDMIFSEYFLKEPDFAVRFVVRFNDIIDRMREGPEYAYVAKALEEIERFKEGRMIPEVERMGYRVPRPPKDLRERASELVSRVMG